MHWTAPRIAWPQIFMSGNVLFGHVWCIIYYTVLGVAFKNCLEMPVGPKYSTIARLIHLKQLLLAQFQVLVLTFKDLSNFRVWCLKDYLPSPTWACPHAKYSMECLLQVPLMSENGLFVFLEFPQGGSPGTNSVILLTKDKTLFHFPRRLRSLLVWVHSAPMS